MAWDDTPTETSYTVRWRQSQAGSWQGQAALAQDTTSYTISDLQPETEYLIQVEATGPGGTAAAGPISATTQGAPPPAATNLQVTGATSTSISLSWQDNASNETGYRVEHRLQGAPSWTQGPNLPADTTSHTVTGLQADTTYELRVVAFNSWGSSASETVQAATSSFYDDFSSNPTWLSYGFSWDSARQDVYVSATGTEQTRYTALPVGSRGSGHVEATVSISSTGNSPRLVRGGVTMRRGSGFDGIHLLLSTWAFPGPGCSGSVVYQPSVQLWIGRSGSYWAEFCHNLPGYPSGSWTVSHVLGLSVHSNGTIKVFLDGTLLTQLTTTLPTGSRVTLTARLDDLSYPRPRFDNVSFFSTPR